ncbi:hypothetical protein [Candidatus Nitrospira bockiana]
MEQQGRRIEGMPGLAGPTGGVTAKADDAAAAVGERLEATAETLRERLPQEGRMGEVAGAVSDRVQRAGYYLQEEGLSGLIAEVEAMIRRYPVQALLIGLGVGYALSRLRTRSS